MLRYDAETWLRVDMRRLSSGSASTVTTLADRVGVIRLAKQVRPSEEEEEMRVEAYDNANHESSRNKLEDRGKVEARCE